MAPEYSPSRQWAFGLSTCLGAGNEDLLFAQGSSPSGQFAQQWLLRIMAQEAASKEVANS